MSIENVKLQYVLLTSNFPDTPIFEEKIRTTLARRLNDYSSFTRNNNPYDYALFHDKPQSRTNISTGHLNVIAESLALGELNSMLIRFGDLLDNILNDIQVSSAQRFHIECRYLLHDDKPKEKFEFLVSQAFSNRFIQTLNTQLNGPTIQDIKPSTFSFFLPSGELCGLFSRVIFSESLLREMFSNTYDECKPGGLLVSVSLEIRKENEKDKLDFRKFSEIVEKEVPAISDMMYKYILEPDTEVYEPPQSKSPSIAPPKKD